MFIWIPGEFIAFLTFPGVVIHEIAHRLACDFFNVPVYEVNYFRPLDKTAGHVLHEDSDSFWVSFLIGIAPFILNSILCMILTFPMGIRFYLGTSFLGSPSHFREILGIILCWAGLSIGFNAIPSNQDISVVWDKNASHKAKALLILAQFFFFPFNLTVIGPILSALYAYSLSLILPAILLR